MSATPDLVDATALVPVADLGPVPVYGGAQMVEAFRQYQQLQQALDRAMPDQIIAIEGKRFRKKGYWRALAVAFNLTVEAVHEERTVQGTFEDDSSNFGYLVTYRASARHGRTVTGDGSCFAIEKARRSDGGNPWSQRPRQATEHNIRSHAHTRAFNRAVSNLVGFGEVSAEEIDRDERPAPARPFKAPQNSAAVETPAPMPADQVTITDTQRKKLWAVARRHGWTEPELKVWLKDLWNYDTTQAIRREHFDGICEQLGQHATDAGSR